MVSFEGIPRFIPSTSKLKTQLLPSGRAEETSCAGHSTAVPVSHTRTSAREVVQPGAHKILGVSVFEGPFFWFVKRVRVPRFAWF